MVVRRRRLILACLLLAAAAGVVVTMLTKPAYLATAVVDVERQNTAAVSFGPTAGGGADSEFLPSQTQLMQSREIAERVVRRLNLLADPNLNPKRFQKYRPDAKGRVPVPSEEALIGAALDVQGRIEATIVRGTSLVEISCTAPTAKLAAAMANAVADAYMEWNGESRFKSIGESAQFLATQIDQAKAELDAKEKELLNYGRQREIVISSDSSMNPAATRLDATNRDLAHRDDGSDQQGGALPGAAQHALRLARRQRRGRPGAPDPDRPPEARARVRGQAEHLQARAAGHAAAPAADREHARRTSTPPSATPRRRRSSRPAPNT